MLLLFFLAVSAAAPLAPRNGHPTSNNKNNMNMLNLLMVGNSFTNANGLEEMVQGLLEETTHHPVYALRFQHGGAKFVEHATDTNLAAMMTERTWTWVVLQEQSEIPGFWQTDYVQEYKDSLQAALVLNDWVREKAHAETFLLMTWGRRTADPYNPTLFPDFSTMQARVAAGYINMQHHLSTADRPVRIAPAGLAFKTVYQQVQAAGIEDPTANGTAFANLYADDGIHPSLAGSYLVACVIYATLTGRTDLLPLLQYTPPAAAIVDSNHNHTLTATFRQQLQHAAAVTVNQFFQQQQTNAHYHHHHPPLQPPLLPNANAGGSRTHSRPYIPPHTNDDDKEPRSLGGTMVMVLVLVSGVAFTLTRVQRQGRRPYYDIPTSHAVAGQGLVWQLEMADLDHHHDKNKNKNQLDHATGMGKYGEHTVL